MALPGLRELIDQGRVLVHSIPKERLSGALKAFWRRFEAFRGANSEVVMYSWVKRGWRSPLDRETWLKKSLKA